MRSEERRVGKGVDHCVTGVQTCALPIWIKSAAPNALPLILTHGWPGSVLEFHKMIDALSTPHGPAGVAFDVVIPSLPGYGFSSRPARPIGPRRVAALWARLMTEVLGYGKFVAQRSE